MTDDPTRELRIARAALYTTFGVSASICAIGLHNIMTEDHPIVGGLVLIAGLGILIFGLKLYDVYANMKELALKRRIDKTDKGG